MAVGVGFQAANEVFYAPKGSTNCVDLETFTDGQQVVSCWRCSEEELAQIAETGVIWVSVQGTGIPPMFVGGLALVEVDGKPAKAQPILPTKPMKDR